MTASLAAENLPRVDLHVHLDAEEKGAATLTPGDAAALSRKLGVRFGVLGEGGCGGDIHDDATLLKFLRGFDGVPMYRGLQVYGFDWRRCLAAQNLKQLDYLAADALVFPWQGRNIWLWLPDVRFEDPQAFMQAYVEYNVRVLSQGIQVWSNPTYVPESLKMQYDALWTPERMNRVIEAAVKNGVAIELNTRFRVPSEKFVRLAKKAGARFTFGSNGHAKGVGDISYGLEIARRCGITKADIWMPSRKLQD